MTTPGHTSINPKILGTPHGYSHGMLAAKGRLLFVAGQVGFGTGTELVSDRFVPQFERALENVVTVVREAGGSARDICRFTIFVIDKRDYTTALAEVGAAYRRHMGKHFPAMTLVEVAGLIEPGTRVEIEATAVISE